MYHCLWFDYRCTEHTCKSIQNWSVNPTDLTTVPPDMLVFFSFQYHSGSRAISAVHCLYPKEQAFPRWLLSATRPDWIGFPVRSGCAAGFLPVSNAWSTSSGRLLDILTDSEELQTWTSQINRLCIVEWGSQDQVVFTCAFILQVGTIFLTFWQIEQLSNGAGVQ